MICGILAVGAVFGLFCYVTNSKRSATKFKRDHPVLSLLVIFSGGYFVVYMLGSVLIFLFGIMLPVVLIFIHSSLRLRSMRNKLTNKIETIGLKKTPMGLFLEALGQESSITS
ncbi:PRA1 family protein 3 [Trichonephila inaurata madagascariensis]|uniref:PRA1 family protein n=1 Tax=Trichonephila inaurata madagascariensis TaxID=2747483 RepID=A0A8X6K2I5_9ARAC|nr:PRA1 family protein 3 [Trichonephila inaurata madagascariensis]